MDMSQSALLLDGLIVALAVAGALAIFFFTQYRNETKRFRDTDRIRENYTQIVKESNDALFVIDIADGKIHETNRSAAEILNYSEGTLKTLSLFDIHPKEKLEQSSEAIADTWEQGGLVYSHLPYVTKEGEAIPMESSAKVMPYDGRPSITIYARDIRERLRLQAEILEQSRIIEEKNKDLTDSIVYARRIQQSILPSLENVNKAFPESFIYYQPKDIVSGDFYFFLTVEDRHWIACADCTGHGVPGAFMSMLGNTLLNEIIKLRNVQTPGKALDELDLGIRNALRQDRKEDSALDGMDIALMVYDPSVNTLEYAGAMRPLIMFRKYGETYEMKDYKADRESIGGKGTDQKPAFQTHRIQLQPGDTFYTMTDGYVDQFGGDRGRKYMGKRFKRLLEEILSQPLARQEKALSDEMTAWMGDAYDQVDDILVIGLRF